MSKADFIFKKNIKKVLTKSSFSVYNSRAVDGKQTKNVVPETEIWDLSSAGRASALQAEGHRFEPYRSHILKNMAR